MQKAAEATKMHLAFSNDSNVIYFHYLLKVNITGFGVCKVGKIVRCPNLTFDIIHIILYK